MLLVMATYPRTHRTDSELIVRWIDAYGLSGCEPGDEVLKCLEAFALASQTRVYLSRVCFSVIHTHPRTAAALSDFLRSNRNRFWNRGPHAPGTVCGDVKKYYENQWSGRQELNLRFPRPE